MTSIIAIGIDSLKIRINQGEITPTILDDYKFYLENNDFNIEEEQKLIENFDELNKIYFSALINFRKTNFEKSFEQLKTYVPNNNITNNWIILFSEVSYIISPEQNFEQFFQKEYNKKFYKSLLAYKRGEYLNSLNLLNSIDSLSEKNFYIQYKKSYCLRNLGRYKDAENVLNSYFNLSNNSRERLSIMNALGSIYYLSGQYDRAKTKYLRVINKSQAINYSTELIKAQINLSIILDEEGELKQARKGFAHALELSQKCNNIFLKATCLTERAVSYTYSNEVKRAKADYEASLALFKQFNNRKRFALNSINQGNLYLTENNYLEALSRFKDGLKNSTEDKRAQMLAFRGLGDVYLNMANFSQSEKYYNKAIILSNELKDEYEKVKTKLGLGILYNKAGKGKEAIELLKSILEEMKEDSTSYEYAQVLQKIGIFTNSEVYLKKSRSIFEKYGDSYSTLLSSVFLSYGKILKGMNNLAKNESSKLLSDANNLGNEQLLGTAGYLVALNEYVLGNFNKSYKIAAKGIKNATRAIDKNLIVELCILQSKSLKKLGRVQEQEAILLKAIKNLEKILTIPAKDDLEIEYFSTKFSVYDELSKLYIEEKRYSDAFNIIEKSRARSTFNNILQKRIVRKGAGNLLEKYLDSDWEIRNNLYSAESLYVLQEKQTELLAQIREKVGPSLFDNNSINQSNFDLSSSSIPSSTALVTYTFDENHNLIALLIDDRNLRYVHFDIVKDELLGLLGEVTPYFDMKINDGQIEFNKDLFSFSKKKAIVLYNKIFKNLEKEISGKTNIVFSLPNELAKFPFEMLIKSTNVEISDGEKPHYLAELYNISYTPSFRIFFDLQNKKPSKKGEVLLIGNPSISINNGEKEKYSELRQNGLEDVISPLYFAEEEVENIGKILDAKYIFLGKEASERNFKNKAGNSSIIHIATHSLLSEQRPIILLSRTKVDEDGMIEMPEIIDLDLPNSLVTLSSCKSGLGKVEKGEGIIGMQKAFFEAGASSIIVSLWEVSDRYTSKFMELFYSGVSKGKRLNIALADAKKEFIHTVSENPYYWGAFVLSGSFNQIQILETEPTYKLGWFIASILLVLTTLIIYVINKKKIKLRKSK